MKDTQLIPNILSESRFCRRLHAIADLTAALFPQLGQVFKVANLSTEYLIDSFPVEVCDNIRINRCQIVTGEEHEMKRTKTSTRIGNLSTQADLSEIGRLFAGKMAYHTRLCMGKFNYTQGL